MGRMGIENREYKVILDYKGDARKHKFNQEVSFNIFLFFEKTDNLSMLTHSHIESVL